MEVMLTSELEAFIHEKVQSGRYRDANAVFLDALRALKAEEYESPELEAELLKGLEGPYQPYGPETWERIRRSVQDKNGSHG